MRLLSARLIGIAVVCFGRAPSAAAQFPPPPAIASEQRIDLIAGARPALQIGGGIQVPMGVYARLGLDGGAGIGIGRASTPGGRVDARLDLLARFLLDPYRQSRLGFSAGAGIGVRAEPGDRVRPLLLVALELEGERRTSGLAPAFQVGLGGGLRLGVVLRRGESQRR